MYSPMFQVADTNNYVIMRNPGLLKESWLEAYLAGIAAARIYKKHQIMFANGVTDVDESDALKCEFDGIEVLAVSGPIFDEYVKGAGNE